MNIELRKKIYTRSRLRNRHFKNPTKENETFYKKNEISVFHSEGSLSHNIFLENYETFLGNKGCLQNDDIILLDGEKIITSDRILAKCFNEHYINIVKRSSGF